MKVSVIGCGYVGLVTGICLAEIGHMVTCLDVDQAKVNNLREGVSPIYEPGLSELMERNKARLVFTDSYPVALEGAQIILLAVGTPSTALGKADLTALFRAVADLARWAKKDQVIVVKSTVPVGTCDKIEDALHQPVISNPEFLKEGTAIQDCLHPDRIVLGISSANGLADLLDLYKPFVLDDPSKILIMDRRSSEMTKYASNAMLATRVSFMNELSVLCESYGANIDQVRQGMGRDVRIGPKFLYAGPGYGGSCFPKDVSALIQMGDEKELDLILLKSVVERNEIQREHVIQKVVDYYRGVMVGKKIVVWGVAFKPGTDDVRDAPSQDMILAWLQAGARVVVHDPKALKTFASEFGPHEGLTYSEEPYEPLFGADALVLITEWPEYKMPDWEMIARAMFKKVVFDFRNQWDFDHLSSLGFYYNCVGRPCSESPPASIK